MYRGSLPQLSKNSTDTHSVRIVCPTLLQHFENEGRDQPKNMCVRPIDTDNGVGMARGKGRPGLGGSQQSAGGRHKDICNSANNKNKEKIKA